MDKENKGQHTNVETYTEDMARVLKDDKSGIIKKIIHEEESRRKERQNFSPESRKNKIEMIVSFILVVASFGILFLSIAKNRLSTVPVFEQATPLIFLDKTYFIETSSLDRKQIVASILSEASQTNLKQEGIEAIYFTENKKIIGLRKFLSLIEANFAPPKPPFMSDQFLAGIYKGENRNFFLILKVRSMLDAFEPMRSWEEKMLSDLAPLFGREAGDYPFGLAFQDGVVENRNARILYDEEENPILMYVFLNDTTVVIAGSEEAIHEIAIRLYSAASNSI